MISDKKQHDTNQDESSTFLRLDEQNEDMKSIKDDAKPEEID